MGNPSNKTVLSEHLVNAVAVQKFLTSKIGEQFDEPSSTCISDLYSASLIVRHDIEKQILQRENLSWTGMLMMYTLWVWGESETKIIAKRLQLAPSSVTSLTNTLEKKGLVVRVYKPTDRRLVLVKLTTKGDDLLSTLAIEVNQRGKLLTSGLEDEEVTELNRLLKKFLSNATPQL